MGHRRGQSHSRVLWDTQEVGKPQGFMKHMGGQVHLGQGWGHPRGLRGTQRGVGSQGPPQKLMSEPRPVAPPLLQALMEPPLGGRTHIPTYSLPPSHVNPHWGGAWVPARCTGSPLRQAMRTWCWSCRAR